MSDLDNLLDCTLDDLADLPSFKPFPAGAHRVTLSLETDDISKRMKKPCVEANLTLIETVELADPNTPEGEVSKEGDTANTLFMLDNEFGQGALKAIAKPLGEALGCSSLREVVEQSKDVECLVITKIQVDKKDSDKKYLKISELQVI